MEKDGQVVEQNGVLPDPFWNLVTAARASNTSAKIRMFVGNTAAIAQGQPTGEPNTWPRCECTLEIECPQDKTNIDFAAELVFRTALEYMNDGMSHLVQGYAPIPYKR